MRDSTAVSAGSQSMESKMYISESNGSSPKFASTNSIPALVDGYVNDLPSTPGSRKSSVMLSPSSGVILRDSKGRRHSVLDELKARRDSFFQKARRSSIFGSNSSEDKENKRRSSDSTTPNRRGSVFYVSSELIGDGERVDPEKSNEDEKKDDGNDNDDDGVKDGERTPRSKHEEELDQPLASLEQQQQASAKKGRRKSWHPLMGKPPKLDRKRRKGVASSASGGASPGDELGSAEILYSRQKRPSWWNIFVPDSVTRSRRMSQDVTTSRSTENLTSFFRSKSRSVDHGFTAPFDLDSLRNKVEGRFESIDKLSRDSDNSDKDGSGQEKKSGRNSQPINTIAYTVGDRDTLTSVAARFDTTPSELSKLNRLVGTFIYPGQQLWVPEKGEAAPGRAAASGGGDPDSSTHEQDHQHLDDLPPEEKELLNNLRPVSPKPGHLERVKTPLGSANAMDEDVQPYKERFLKITVRHITDGQGVVEGVLLVTPNAVMFDPNVSDPLVIEHGAESYGVIAPMEFIVNAAIYFDIAHMRVGHAAPDPQLQSDKKPEIYYMKKPELPVPPTVSEETTTTAGTTPEPASATTTTTTTTTAGTGTDTSSEPRKSSSSPGKDEHFPELTVDDSESVCSCAERADGDAFPKAFDKDLVTPTAASPSDETKDKDKEKDETKEELGIGQASRTLEERRRSMLDHHWAVPSKDRCSFSQDDEQQDSLNSEKADSSKSNAIPEDEEGSLVKQSCHDSGIDIRDPVPPIPVVQPIPAKKVYSDADIVLSSDWVPPITIAPTNVTSNTLDTDTMNGRKKASSVSFSLDSNNEEQEKDDDHKEDDKQETRKNKMLKRLSYPLSWMEGLTGDSKDEDSKPASDKMSSLPNSADSHHSSVFSKVFSRRSSVGTFIRQQPLNSSGSSSVDSNRGSKMSTATPRLDYRSMVSVEDMPELFVSFDKLIPRPARSCEDPPLYLRLRTGRPKDKKIPWSTPIMSYGKKKIRPEYWFSIPRNRVDDLYRFIHAWVPQLYGELDEDLWRERGYILSDTDTDLSPELTPRAESGEPGDDDDAKDPDGKGAEISELTRESWEVLSMSEELRRALYASGGPDLDVLVPDLVGTTEILSDDHRENLCRHLPARAQGYLWTLVFSTSQHGFSLNSMYRKMSKIESPILLVIEDTEGNVFGALTSVSLRVSDHFYGTGESLLFRFTPRFQVFNWTGENVYFIKGNNESLAIGAGDGKFGLWLDGDLYQGRTQSCSTYGNEPLAPHEDFVVKTLECYAFI